MPRNTCKNEFVGTKKKSTFFTYFKSVNFIRNFYFLNFLLISSLIKMVFCFARQCQDVPSLHAIEHAVKRNFSGLEELDTWGIFKEQVAPILQVVNYRLCYCLFILDKQELNFCQQNCNYVWSHIKRKF